MKPVTKARSFICGEYESSMLYELVDQGHQNAEQTALIHATSRIWEKMMNIKRIGGKMSHVTVTSCSQPLSVYALVRRLPSDLIH